MTDVTVIIPVLNRPHRAAAVAQSVRDTSDADILFVCTEGDAGQIAACKETGARVVVASWQPGRGDYAKKVNLAFRETNTPWVFTAADDLVFHPDWDREAIRASRRIPHSAAIVGTQDLGNPMVRKGAHSTHSLVSRRYVEDHGGHATFDRTGEVYSERYWHEFVDNELVATARHRGRWVFAHRSVVEHLHPVWGKAQEDDVYRRAVEHRKEDTRLFMERMKLMPRAARTRLR